MPRQPDTTESETAESDSAPPSKYASRLPSEGLALVIEEDAIFRKHRSTSQQDDIDESASAETASTHYIFIDKTEEVRPIIQQDVLLRRRRHQAGTDGEKNRGDQSFVAKGHVISRKPHSVPRQPDTAESETGESDSAHHSNDASRLPLVGLARVIEDYTIFRKRRSKPKQDDTDEGKGAETSVLNRDEENKASRLIIREDSIKMSKADRETPDNQKSSMMPRLTGRYPARKYHEQTACDPQGGISINVPDELW